MNAAGHKAESGARRLQGSMLEHPGLEIDRLPALAYALEQFVGESTRRLAPLVGPLSGGGSVEDVRATTLFQAIGDCKGLIAAIYACAEPEARLLIALDERIDELVVACVFGETPGGEEPPAPDDDAAPRGRTAIETALIEEFARCLGRALAAAFAPVATLAFELERLIELEDGYALGRRDMPAAAARFSLQLNEGACEGLVVLPHTLLLPLRNALARNPADEPAPADRHWSVKMEAGVKQTRLPVIAILAEEPLTLGDIARFEVGTVLPLSDPGFGSVRLECSGRGMFLCRLGQGDGRYRLEVEKAIPTADTQATP